MRKLKRYDSTFRNARRFWACVCGHHVSAKPPKKRCPACGEVMEHFASKGEHKRWRELRLLEQAGEIAELRRQVRVRLRGANGYLRHLVSGRPYVLAVDFVYRDLRDGVLVYEDYKSSGSRGVALEPLSELKYAVLRAQLPDDAEVRINGWQIKT